MCTIFKINGKYYLRIQRESKIEEILEHIIENTGMRKGSFADKYVVKIMTGILYGAVDQRVRYERYYSKEYISFKDYLYNKELIDRNTIETLALQENETLFMLCLTDNDYSITNIIGYEDENLSLINRLLGSYLT